MIWPSGHLNTLTLVQYTFLIISCNPIRFEDATFLIQAAFFRYQVVHFHYASHYEGPSA